MKKIILSLQQPVFFIIILFNLISWKAAAQMSGCNLQPPVIKIDFGTEQNEWKLTPLRNYKLTESCPDDGYMSVVSYSGDCFSAHWHKIFNDHSSMGRGGKMLIVNASYEPGIFFMVNISGLKSGAKYQLASWIANICKVDRECVNIPPLLEFTIESRGKILKRLISGNIYPGNNLEWKQYAGFFEMPGNETAITLKITDLNRGGCGNDFAIDDITISECLSQVPIVKSTKSPAPNNTEIEKPSTAPIANKAGAAPVLPTLDNQSMPEIKPEIVTSTTPQNKITELPVAIRRRANPVIKKITTPASEMLVELYDNGQIDGDTISVYHNNDLILSRAGLTAKPLTFKININAQHPHHELVMVAENLGSIPPNTSLMIVTALDKRY